jgi:hypothetical protein
VLGVAKNGKIFGKINLIRVDISVPGTVFLGVIYIWNEAISAPQKSQFQIPVHTVIHNIIAIY